MPALAALQNGRAGWLRLTMPRAFAAVRVANFQDLLRDQLVHQGVGRPLARCLVLSRQVPRTQLVLPAQAANPMAANV